MKELTLRKYCKYRVFSNSWLVFLKLFLTGEAYEESFDLKQLFKEIDFDWIEFAMDRLLTYFYYDTYLTLSPKPLYIKNPNVLLSQKECQLLCS